MCIVSIFSKSNGDFLLTHNRDESHLRPFSDEIKTNEYFGHRWTGPVDLVSGGTWIYYSEEFVCCVLNGGYQKHHHRPPYRMSRGLLILELLKYNSINEFIKEIELNEIEPFTMIMLSQKSVEKKILVWDGKEKFIEDHSDQKLIVRSSTPLYTAEDKKTHYRAFSKLENISEGSVFELHDQLKMLPNSKFPTVQTTSITQISHSENQIGLKFCPILF